MTSGIQWKFCEAEDCSVDSEYRLLVNDADVGISVQVCTFGGGYGVNRYAGEGDEFCVYHHGQYQTLKMAKAVGQRVFRTGH